MADNCLICDLASGVVSAVRAILAAVLPHCIYKKMVTDKELFRMKHRIRGVLQQ